MKKKALVILHPGFEEMEAVAPIDLLARAKIEVTQASVGQDLLVTGRNGITLQATHYLRDVLNESFDAVIIPGGPGIHQIRQHPELCALLHKQQARGGLVACICAAPLLLLDAGLLKGVAHTAHPSTSNELPNAGKGITVQDSNILTSPGAGTATEFALEIVRNLTNTSNAQSIAESICWTPLA